MRRSRGFGEPSRSSCREPPVARSSPMRRSPSSTAGTTAGSRCMPNSRGRSWPTRLTASADQLRAVWGPFVAEAGTFEVSGSDVITMRATVAKNPAAMRDGASSVYTYRRQGDTLTLTEVRTPAGPSATADHGHADTRRVISAAHQRRSVMTSSRRASLLVVLAHPDDEIFHGGMLTHLSEQGVRVTLACATNGEAGKPHPSVGSVDDLGALRVEELRLSCDRLGIEPPVLLGFHDSARGERQRHGDARALANVDMLEVEAAIRRIIQDVTPQVLLTFDPHGGYYHPDHLAVQRATTAAFFSSGTMGRTSHRSDCSTARCCATCFGVWPRRVAGAVSRTASTPTCSERRPEMVAVSFDARSLVHQKFMALAAHRSAFGVTEEMLSSPPPGAREMLDAFRPVFEREVFVLGGTRISTPHWPLRDLFDGIHSAELERVTTSFASA